MDSDDFGGHSRGPSPFFMFQMMGAAMIPLIAIGLFAPLALYIVARWRDSREPLPDPHLGIKFALGFFKWQAYLVSLMGVGMLLYSVTTKLPSEAREMLYRPAFGLLLPGLLVFGMAAFGLTKTNQGERPLVGRLLAGFNLMIVGMAGFAFLIIAFQTLFEKGEAGDGARAIWSFTLVFVAAWVTQTIMFLGEVSNRTIPPAP
ncbi:MAG TPA: hypothetical protein VL463_36410 [Kofleriaceae bacterium]|nr:hypothetical protein [Kofleriaceae bacterium]